MTALRAAAIGVGVGAVAGLALGAALWLRRPVVETPAPEVRQPDGSLVLERAPDPTVQPRHAIPRGTRVDRVVSVTVQPDSGIVVVPRETDNRPADTTGMVRVDTLRCACEPVTVDLTLVREPNGARRVVASARGGAVIGGLDVPVESAREARPLRWAVGAAYSPLARRWGAFLERDMERVPGLPFLPIPMRVGASVTPHGAFTKDGRTTTAIDLRIGLRF